MFGGKNQEIDFKEREKNAGRQGHGWKDRI